MHVLDIQIQTSSIFPFFFLFYIFRSAFRLYVQNVWSLNVQWKLDQLTLTNQGLEFGSDVWVAPCSIHGSANVLKSDHEGEINICDSCPAGIIKLWSKICTFWRFHIKPLPTVTVQCEHRYAKHACV